MLQKISSIALWLFVIDLGIVFGAGLYEARIEFNQWLVVLPDGEMYWNGEAARESNTGLRFWVFSSTITLTLLTLINLVLACRSDSSIRKYWLTAALAALADRVFTFSYFIPTMINLMQSQTLSESDAVNTAALWGTLNYVRHLLVFIAWIAALKTFKGLERSLVSVALPPKP
jgi:hypothetical protein